MIKHDISKLNCPSCGKAVGNPIIAGARPANRAEVEKVLERSVMICVKCKAVLTVGPGPSLANLPHAELMLLVAYRPDFVKMVWVAFQARAADELEAS